VRYIFTLIAFDVMLTVKPPGLWWLGAAMLVTGSVIIGRREEGSPEDALEKVDDQSTSNGSSSKPSTGDLDAALNATQIDDSKTSDEKVRRRRGR
jgi:hypothetical protein